MKEAGMEILRKTSCQVGNHCFTWTGYGIIGGQEPDPNHRCNCGLLTWREYQDLRPVPAPERQP